MSVWQVVSLLAAYGTVPDWSVSVCGAASVTAIYGSEYRCCPFFPLPFLHEAGCVPEQLFGVAGSGKTLPPSRYACCQFLGCAYVGAWFTQSPLWQSRGLRWLHSSARSTRSFPWGRGRLGESFMSVVQRFCWPVPVDRVLSPWHSCVIDKQQSSEPHDPAVWSEASNGLAVLYTSRSNQVSLM